MKAERIFIMGRNGLGLVIGVALLLCAQTVGAEQVEIKSEPFQIKVSVLGKCEVLPASVVASKGNCKNEVLQQVVTTPVEVSGWHVVGTRDKQDQAYRVTVIY